MSDIFETIKKEQTFEVKKKEFLFCKICKRYTHHVKTEVNPENILMTIHNIQKYVYICPICNTGEKEEFEGL